jgi:hypothetical protein
MPVSLYLRAASGPIPSVTYRGMPLTNDEVDLNFINLKTAVDAYVASDVLIKLKTVDGPGSGLNADLLDDMNTSTTHVSSTPTVVARDASGNFSANVITATSFIGAIGTIGSPTTLIGNVIGNVSGSAGTVAFGGLTGTPTIWDQNTTGTAAGLSTTLAVASGGTGGTTATQARANLSAAITGTNGDITQLTGLLTPLTVLQGGTGVNSKTGTGSVVLSISPTLVTPILGIPGSGDFSAGAFTWPIFNQNTSGSAASLITTNSYQIRSLSVGTTAPSATIGEIRATNNITAYYSDARLKDVLGNIKNPLDAVKSLDGVIYKANHTARQYGYTSDEEQVGVLSQQVQKVLPQIVTPAPFDIGQNADGTEYSKSGDNYMTVHYERLVPLLIEAIKELDAKVTELQNKISG